MSWFDVQSQPEIRTFYLNKVKNFDLIASNYSVTFRPHGKKGAVFVSQKWFGVGVLCLISKVKSQAKKWAQAHPNLIENVPPCRPFHFKTVKYNGQVFEYDMRQAYLTTALEAEIIDKPLHARISKLPKQLRLAVLGAIAVKKTVFRYVDGVKVDSKIKFDPVLRKVWLFIVYETDRKMREIFNQHPSSVFYWFDALFSTQKIDLPPEAFKIKTTSLKIDPTESFVVLSDGRVFPYLREFGNFEHVSDITLLETKIEKLFDEFQKAQLKK